MIRKRYVGVMVVALLFVLLLGACVPIQPEASGGTVPAESESEPASETYTDPFAYCAAVGTVDAPDERWAGDEQPIEIAEGLRGPLGTPAETPTEDLLHTMVWRCADGQVYACLVGANLPCQEKADLSTEPSDAIRDYCVENPDAEFVPAFVTGRATAYAWSCVGDVAQAGDQVMQVDDQGFFSDIWYQVEQPQ